MQCHKFSHYYFLIHVWCYTKLHLPCTLSVIRRYSRVNLSGQSQIGQSSCYFDLRSKFQLDLLRSKSGGMGEGGREGERVRGRESERKGERGEREKENVMKMFTWTEPWTKLSFQKKRTPGHLKAFEAQWHGKSSINGQCRHFSSRYALYKYLLTGYEARAERELPHHWIRPTA